MISAKDEELRGLATRTRPFNFGDRLLVRGEKKDGVVWLRNARKVPKDYVLTTTTSAPATGPASQPASAPASN